MTAYRADLVLVGTEFVRDGVVTVDERGRIAGVGTGSEFDVDLGAVALVPGLVNAHSHSFQRLIRGRTEWSDPTKIDDFWSWRDLMYRAAQSLTPEEIEAVARYAFIEMLLTGVTAVGEFHYLHNPRGGGRYSDPNETAHRVISAARDVGIRIRLLKVAYARAGFGREPLDEQARFVTPDLETFVADVDDLRSVYRDDGAVGIGCAPHSIRAVNAEWIRGIAEANQRWKAPVHVHACEQRREIEESLAEYDAAPIAVLADRGLVDERLTVVHATHLEDGDARRLGQAGATVCACPSTEANLGDGFVPAEDLLQARVPIALGSDSQASIDLWAEMRLVEYQQRLLKERRNVVGAFDGRGGNSLQTAAVLWPMGTANGARSLGFEAGTIEVGRHADMVAVDLEHPSLVGADAGTLLADLCFSVVPGAVRSVWVGGRRVIDARDHSVFVGAAAEFRQVAKRVFGGP